MIRGHPGDRGRAMSFRGADMVGLIRWLVVGSAVVALASAELPRTALRAAPPEDDASALAAFENEVRPLLADQCYECHGPKKQESGLRLDQQGRGPPGGDSGPAVVPGKPDESLLVQAVRHEDDLEMPPDGKLTDERDRRPDPLGRARCALARRRERVAAARRRGHARGPGVLVVPAGRPPPAPAVKDRDWPQDAGRPLRPGDAGGQGAAAGRAPADRRTLIRRATFDLTGLPPTPEEVDAFLADASPDAFAKVVDRLLASPALRRALGPALARRRPLRRHRGRDRRLPRPRGVPLPRLRDRRVQRATCRTTSSSASSSPATSWPATARRDDYAERVIATGFLAIGAAVRVRRRERSAPDDRGHDRHPRPGVPRPDARLRPLPRPQVRPDPDGGLLRPLRHLREHPLSRSPAPSRSRTCA